MSDETPVNPIHWEIHDTNPDLVPGLRTKLAEVVDPEIMLNVLQLGLIRKVRIENGVGKAIFIVNHSLLSVWTRNGGNDQTKSRRGTGNVPCKLNWVLNRGIFL